MNEELIHSSISASWDQLRAEGLDDVNMYLSNAIKQIDKKLGDGYAKEHPELIGAYMNAVSIATNSGVIGKCILQLRDSMEGLNNTISLSIENIAEKM